MKKIFLILFLLVGLAFSQTSYYEMKLRSATTDKLVANKNVDLYQDGAKKYDLTESASIPGVYSHNAIANGYYDIYVNGSLYKANIWIGAKKISTIADNFNDDGLLLPEGVDPTIAGPGLKGGAGDPLEINVGKDSGFEFEDDSLYIADTFLGDGLGGGSGIPAFIKDGYALQIVNDSLMVIISQQNGLYIENDTLKININTDQLEFSANKIQIKKDGITESEIADSTIIMADLSQAVIAAMGSGGIQADEVTIEVYMDGEDAKIRVKNLGIDSTKIANNQVPASKIPDENIYIRHLNQEVKDYIETPILDNNIIILEPGDDINEAITNIPGDNTDSNWYVVMLTPGEYALTTEIVMRPFIALVGWSDQRSSVLTLNSASTSFIRSDSGNVVIKNLGFYNAATVTTSALPAINLRLVANLGATLAPVYLENLYLNVSYNVGTNYGGGITINGDPDGYAYFNCADRKSIVKNITIRNRTNDKGAGIAVLNCGSDSQNFYEGIKIENCYIENFYNGIYFYRHGANYSFLSSCFVNSCYRGITDDYVSGTTNDVFIYISGGEVSNSANAGLQLNNAYVVFETNNFVFDSFWMNASARLKTDKSYGMKYKTSDIEVLCDMDAWKKITGLDAGEYQGVKIVGDSLKIVRPGMYEVYLNASLFSTGQDTISCAIFKNNTIQASSQFTVTSATIGSDVLIANGSNRTLLSLAENDYLSFRILNSTDNDNPILKNCKFGCWLVK